MRPAAPLLALALLLAGCASLGAKVDPPPADDEAPARPADDDGAAPPGPRPSAPTATTPAGDGALAPAASADPAPGRPARSAVVVAVVDTGINPYHAEYRRAASARLPDGVPPAVPVTLALHAADHGAALAADEGKLAALEPRTLYAFPGTKILAISFLAKGDAPLVLDDPAGYAHGTMTSSRAAGNTVSMLRDDPDAWLVLVQGLTPEAVAWAADQDWIDVVSVSSGLSGALLGPATSVAAPDEIAVFNRASHAKPLFASSGNGAGNVGVAGYPSWLRGASGAPDAISVGANDNDQVTLWHNHDPYVSADGCANPRASPRHLTDILLDGAGTSSATPYAAGGGAKLVLEARRILGDARVGPRVDGSLSAPGGWDSGAPGDAKVVLAQGDAGLVASGPLADGAFTLLELKDVLYHAALATPTDDESDGARCDGVPTALVGGSLVPAALVPPEARFPFHGYGEVNEASIDLALRVLRGAATLPARPHEDAEYARAHAVKSAVVGAGE